MGAAGTRRIGGVTDDRNPHPEGDQNLPRKAVLRADAPAVHLRGRGAADLCTAVYLGQPVSAQEAVSWAVVLIAAPLMLAGFFRYNDMNFEQFALEFIAHHFNPQKRIYEYEPIFMELRRMYLLEEYLAETEHEAQTTYGFVD